ncbi:hypothetical protein HDU87_004289 [Geranomyces variabilis]|uniref:Thioredoxin domain-containing protein n=1 Tax=Geranomyces variabilis TaxID=109894 RepID=A0AAD5XMN5_9FUNG|nr:hypothetical protein HDU87_004289 [Geranomyces variabilis]
MSSRSPRPLCYLTWLTLALVALLACATSRVSADSQTDDTYKATDKLVRHIDPADFSKTVSTDARLVFFGSNFCVHCRAFTPVWLEAQTRSDALKNKFHLEKVECSGRAENEDLCIDQGVTAYPTVKLFFDGEYKEEFLQQRDIATLNAYIDKKSEEYLASGPSTVKETVAKAAGAVGAKLAEALPSASDVKAVVDDGSAAVKQAIAELTELASAGTKPRSDVNPDGKVVELTSETFTLLTNNTPWFIMFHAPWCGHCKKLKPVFEDLAPSLQGLVNIGAVDCTTESKICQGRGVRGYPTVKFMLQPHVELEYRGPRTYQALREFATAFSSKPSFAAVTANEVPAVLAEKEVAFFLLSDPQAKKDSGFLTAFQSVASSMRNDASFYISPDPAARAALLKTPTPGPTIVCVKDNGARQIVFTGDSTGASAQASHAELARFVRSNRYPRVLRLDADNQEEILGGDRLVVIAVVDPTKKNPRVEFSSVLKTVRDAAVQWEQHERAQKLNDLVVFTWLDGGKWASYVERVYGLYAPQLPSIIVADPKEDRYFSTDNAGRAIAFAPESIVQIINEVLDDEATPKYTSGFLARSVQNLTKNLKSLLFNMVFILCFAVLLGLGYMYGPGRRAARAGPKAE